MTNVKMKMGRIRCAGSHRSKQGMALSLKLVTAPTSSLYFLIFLLNLLYISSGQTCNGASRNITAYFDGSASATISRTLDLSKAGFSFRTCLGGSILRQNGSGGDFFQLSANESVSSISISWISGAVSGLIDISANITLQEVSLKFNMTDNTFTLTVDGVTEVLANSTIYPELLSINLTGSDLIVGEGFTGCVIDKNAGIDSELGLCASSSHTNVKWGVCRIENSTNCGLESCSSTPCTNNATCEPFPGGFECLCPAETYSGVCTDEDRCLSSPCENGVCQNTQDGYFCDCSGSGYSGDSCQVNVDDCASTPCENGGICNDGINSFTCSCRGEYGGIFCNETLTGCEGIDCTNGRTCFPLYSEAEGHTYVCNCEDGYRGENCETMTDMSFFHDRGDLLNLEDDSVFRETSLNYSLTFRTTIPDGVLLSSGILADFLLLELVQGTLVFSIKFKGLETVHSATVGQFLNDGEWHKVVIKSDDLQRFDVSVWVDQHNMPPGASCGNTCTTTLTASKSVGSLFLLVIGGDGTVFGPKFVGCMRDVENLITGEFVSDPSMVDGIERGCLRENQCDNSTCSGNGACVDLWWKPSCECLNGYTGSNCTREIEVATFSYKNTTSYASFNVSSIPSSAEIGIEFQFRTRKASGLLFFTQQDTNNSLAIYLMNGQVQADIVSEGSSPDETLVAGSNLNDGIFHLVRFSRQADNVALSVTDAFGETVSSNSSIPNPVNGSTFEVVYIGGAQDCDSLTLKLDTDCYFKGCIWDVKYEQYSLEFFPLSESSLNSIPMDNAASENVLQNNCASEDLCETLPCMNNGTCSDAGLWNEFVCECTFGFTGSVCANETICGPTSNPCPTQSTCVERSDSFECVASVTFEESTVLKYDNNIDPSSQLDSVTFRMRTRSQYGIIFRAYSSGSFLQIEIRERRLLIKYDSEEFPTNFVVDDGQWHAVNITLFTNSISAVVDEVEKSMSGTIVNLNDLILGPNSEPVQVGGVEFSSGPFGDLVGYIGCLEDLRVGGYLLPVFYPTEYNPDLPERFNLTDGEVTIGCRGRDVCASDNCINGVCMDMWNDFSCDCFAGYKGDVCDVDIDECEPNPCLNGNCRDGVANYTCDCDPGYEGNNCSQDINECAPNPCLNGATCNDGINRFDCECPDSFTGNTCEFMVMTNCSMDVCENNATCISKDNPSPGEDGFICECPAGYTGVRCSYQVDYCANVTCLNGGTCSSNATLQMHQCSCAPGFDGEFCGVNIDDCQGVTCQNGGNCEDMIDDFQCICLEGFRGNLCQENIDDCLSQPCLVGNCTDGINSFVCDCPSGYEGEICQADIDECSRDSPCLNDATCSNQHGTYKCICPDNFFGFNCELNPCLSQPCLNGACVSQNATAFSCNCSEGFTGSVCDVVDCSLVTSCQNGGTCGEEPDGSSWTCLCPEFVEGDICQFKGPCASLECKNGAICTQVYEDDAFTGGCTCPQGYNGTECENEIDWCASSPCMNNATCNNTLAGPECTCIPGYAGDVCEIDLPNCKDGVCKNGASCTDFDFSYECFCAEGFSGPNCEEDIDDCVNNNCTNGVCVDEVAGYYCNCTGSGYNGSFCENDINECRPNPCLEGGTCQNFNGTFKCECIAPYTGTYCEEMIMCFVNPCKNSGTCNDNGTCSCLDDYTGPNCETFTGSEPDPTNWVLIGGIIGGVVLLLILIFVIIIILNIRQQRATAGTYSPSRQEMSGSRVEMNNVLKLPPQERLI